MRIGCLQFAPQVGDVDNNLNRADAVLNKSQDVEGLDLLVLPELAFSGYNFHSLAHISPYLEPTGSGISALWARTTALKFNCNVVVGYPEKVDVTQKWPTSPEYYNSAIMINPDGETIANYRKSFLYAVDEKWALEGQDGFFEAQLPDLGNVAMGICMDINPYKFEAPWHAFEFAFHVLEVEANLVILTMSWLTREDPRRFTQLPHEPDMDTLEYWIQRLEPIIRTSSDEEIIVIFCNRTGIEEDAVFAGTSTVIGIKNGEVNLYGMLGRGVKELLVVDTARKPVAKLVRDSVDDEPVHTRNSPKPSRSSSRPIPPPPIPRRPSESYAEPALSLNTNVSSPEATAGSATPAKKTRVATPIVREKAVNWDFMSDMATVSSMPSMKSIPSPGSKNKAGLPQLGLHIPIDAHMQTGSVNLRNPRSGTEQNETPTGDEIPTPTAPSPTPSTLRPKIGLPATERSATVTASGNIIPPSVNVKSGASVVKVSRTDSPVTPPSRASAKDQTRRQASISEAPPSPPTDDRLALPKSKAQNAPKAKASKPKQVVQETRKSEKLVQAEKSLQAAKGEAVKAARAATPSRSKAEAADPTSRKQTPKSSVSRHGTPSKNSPAARASPKPQPKQQQEMKEFKGASLLDRRDFDTFSVSAIDTDTLLELDLALAAFRPSDIPARPPSTKSRNASASRSHSATGLYIKGRSLSQSGVSIPLLASPSVFHTGEELARKNQQSALYFRPDSSLMKGLLGTGTPTQHRKSQSMTRIEAAHINSKTAGMFSPPSLSNATAEPKLGNDANIGRPVSRGRQPYTKTNPTNAPPGSSRESEIIPRVAGTEPQTRQISGTRQNGARQTSGSRPIGPADRLLASRTISATRTRAQSNTSSTWLIETPPPELLQQGNVDPDDEIVAMISLINGSCPVHNGTGSTPALQSGSPPQQHASQQTQVVQQEQEQEQEQSQEQQSQQQQGQSSPQQQGQPSPRQQSSGTPPSRQRRQASSGGQPQPAPAPEDSIYEVILPPHIRDLVESFSTQDRRTQSPRNQQTPRFDPPTPTAMEFSKTDEAETTVLINF